MARLRLSHPSSILRGKISIGGSKSESNRALLLRQLYAPNTQLINLSSSDDTQALQAALSSTDRQVNIGDAGTAMRFATAFFAAQSGREVELSGSERMHQRPIGILVEALRELGAEIEYLGERGYPPLLIRGTDLRSGEIQIEGSVSSQYISALMLIGPSLPNGLHLRIQGFSVSAPYIYLTASTMNRLGCSASVRGENIHLSPKGDAAPATYTVEPDWSSASYWFSMALLAQDAELYLPNFREVSMQGDSVVRGLFEPLGLECIHLGNGFRLKRNGKQRQGIYKVNLVHAPDLAQTLVVACAAIGQVAEFTGLQTLGIKETDRLLALKTELEKTGARLEIGPDWLKVQTGVVQVDGLHFSTWGDHRMALSLAPLALLGSIEIEEPAVVSKSYPNFWMQLQELGFVLETLE